MLDILSFYSQLEIELYLNRNKVNDKKIFEILDNFIKSRKLEF